MSDKLFKRAELAANVAIIAVALVLSGVLIKRYLLTGDGGGAHRRADLRVPAGTKVALPGIDWARNGQTLLLVLSRDCRFCTESAPFYQRLVQETAGRPGIRLVAVLPQEPNEASKYLDDHGIAVSEVRHAPPRSIGAQVTPTLILVDGTGAVKESWVGKLGEAQEAEVSDRLRTSRAGAGEPQPEAAPSGETRLR